MTAERSRFAEIEYDPPIEVFQLTENFKKDTFAQKVNLGVGAYRDEAGKAWVLPVVRKVEAQIANDLTLDHEYLAVAGLEEFCIASTKLALGEDSPALTENRAAGVQCLSGTGALRIAAEFLRRAGFDTVYVSEPTWGNHLGIFRDAHFPNIRKYAYWDAEKRAIMFDRLISDLKAAPPNSVAILHAAAHNPTGSDPTQEQWTAIADVCEERQIFPLFDSAYQGFSSGDLDQDAWAPRYFVRRGFELFVCQSYAKNFGLYNERIGNLAIVTRDADSNARIRSKIRTIIRQMWSNPPAHGARIVATILGNAALFNEWKEHVRTMAARIRSMRELLYQKLKALGTPGTWEHIITQTGMFSYTGLNSKQSEFLIRDYHIYIMRDGRINMCGITPSNVDYVAQAIFEAVSKVDSKV